jgi:hypothetical protein
VLLALCAHHFPPSIRDLPAISHATRWQSVASRRPCHAGAVCNVAIIDLTWWLSYEAATTNPSAWATVARFRPTIQAPTTIARRRPEYSSSAPLPTNQTSATNGPSLTRPPTRHTVRVPTAGSFATVRTRPLVSWPGSRSATSSVGEGESDSATSRTTSRHRVDRRRASQTRCRTADAHRQRRPRACQVDPRHIGNSARSVRLENNPSARIVRSGGTGQTDGVRGLVLAHGISNTHSTHGRGSKELGNPYPYCGDSLPVSGRDGRSG